MLEENRLVRKKIFAKIESRQSTSTWTTWPARPGTTCTREGGLWRCGQELRLLWGGGNQGEGDQVHRRHRSTPGTSRREESWPVATTTSTKSL